MDFYIQMGHGMQSICKELLTSWGGGTAILSPLNIPQDKISSYSASLKKINGHVLFDPQMYSPRKYHKNLDKYTYWPKAGITSIEMGEYEATLKQLLDINNQIQSDGMILPSSSVGKINDLWGRVQSLIALQARKLTSTVPLIHTIALSNPVLDDETQVENIIHYASQWDVDGVYIVCEHPEKYYLVEKPLWVSNLLALVAGIKRTGKKVIVGYASHQLLCMALAKCDAIAAGNFLNVRWFQPQHFETIEETEPSRRAKWYYCPQAFSEYKVTYLDVAHKYNLLSRMAPPPEMANEYSKVLFSGAVPSSTNYKERDSHLHYLHCLKIQCNSATKPTFKETRDSHLALLQTAAHLINGLHNEKIKGQDRDFGDIVDVIEAAISLYDKEFGFAMSQEW
jgi:hypothetical protein